MDVAAATYRVELFARSGLTLWDSQWYGGHWTFNYSVIFAPIGWLAGIPLMEIVCVAVAAWAFDRLAVARFGRSGRVAALVFAAGTIVQVSIGQEPYLLGETIGLVALVAAHARRWPLALPARRRLRAREPADGRLHGARRARLDGRRLAAAPLGRSSRSPPPATVPVGVLELLFPGQGMMPFATLNFIGMTLGCLALGVVVAARRDRALIAGVALYAAALVFTYAVPSAIGSQHHAPGDQLRRRAGRRARRREPARARAAARGRGPDRARPVGACARARSPASSAPRCGPPTSSPLLGFLHRADRPLGRVEVVPTAFHWEAAYVAPAFPLARGWERQLDTANNSIFYDAGQAHRRPPTGRGSSPTACASSRCPTSRSTTRRRPRRGSCATACRD